MKRVLLNVTLLLITALTFGQVTERNKIAFQALKNSTDGENWTVKTMDDLIGRTSAPYILVNGGALDEIEDGIRDKYFNLFDLSNNNLSGTVEDDFCYLSTYTRPDGSIQDLNIKGIFYMRRGLGIKLSHNKITAVNAPHLGHYYNLRKYIDEVYLDNNLLSTVNFKMAPDVSLSNAGIRRVTLHQNDISSLSEANFDRQSLTDCWLSRELELFRIDNNRLDFSSLIRMKDLAYTQST